MNPLKGGWKAVLVGWTDELGGFYEPYQTGLGAYATEVEAKQWAEDEELEYREGHKTSLPQTGTVTGRSPARLDRTTNSYIIWPGWPRTQIWNR